MKNNGSSDGSQSEHIFSALSEPLETIGTKESKVNIEGTKVSLKKFLLQELKFLIDWKFAIVVARVFANNI